jgi:hypothetical protein
MVRRLARYQVFREAQGLEVLRWRRGIAAEHPRLDVGRIERRIALGDGVGLVDLHEARRHAVARSGRDRLADGVTGRRPREEERVDLIVSDGAGDVLGLDL